MGVNSEKLIMWVGASASWERRRLAGSLLNVAISEQNIGVCLLFSFFFKEPPRRRRSQDKKYAALAETAALPGREAPTHMICWFMITKMRVKFRILV
jgi:hypothetical protein